MSFPKPSFIRSGAPPHRRPVSRSMPAATSTTWSWSEFEQEQDAPRAREDSLFVSDDDEDDDEGSSLRNAIASTVFPGESEEESVKSEEEDEEEGGRDAQSESASAASMFGILQREDSDDIDKDKLLSARLFGQNSESSHWQNQDGSSRASHFFGRDGPDGDMYTDEAPVAPKPGSSVRPVYSSILPAHLIFRGPIPRPSPGLATRAPRIITPVHHENDHASLGAAHDETHQQDVVTFASPSATNIQHSNEHKTCSGPLQPQRRDNVASTQTEPDSDDDDDDDMARFDRLFTATTGKTVESDTAPRRELSIADERFTYTVVREQNRRIGHADGHAREEGTWRCALGVLMLVAALWLALEVTLG